MSPYPTRFANNMNTISAYQFVMYLCKFIIVKDTYKKWDLKKNIP